MSSELWFHLPPAAPPLLTLAMIPVRVSRDGNFQWRPAFFTESFGTVRTLILISLGFAILSCTATELGRKQKLAPLPLGEQYLDVDKAFLPPFLPEEVPLSADKVVVKQVRKEKETRTKDAEEETEDVPTGFPNRFRRQLRNGYKVASKTSAKFSIRPLQKLLRSDEERARRRSEKRSATYEELISIQESKKPAANQKRTKQAGQSDLGYALVTGASRGIGRALAVELARRNIPLILVARDKERLMSLATDLEKCYGVKCSVLLADLSQPGVASKIHQATTHAGLRVDMLINNAGLSSSGEFVESDPGIIDNILQVNAVSLTSLSRLYGQDMKRQGRGRILIVSSIMGNTYAGPTVAAYAATKAFEKSLALSMAKELEDFGVGVTCLMPGAVGDSAFRSSSGSEEAICWKFPWYPKTCEFVAGRGVRAMLLGDQEVTPGWMNRAFLNVVKPVLPQQFITNIVEVFWNPVSHTLPTFRQQNQPESTSESITQEMNERDFESWSATTKRAPRLLSLPRVEEKKETHKVEHGAEGMQKSDASVEKGFDEDSPTSLDQPEYSAPSAENWRGEDKDDIDQFPEVHSTENLQREDKKPGEERLVHRE